MAEQDRPGAKIFRRSARPDDARRPGDPAAGDPPRTRARGRRTERAGDAREGSKVPWVALAVAAVLTLWQVIYALTVETVAEASQDVYTSVALFVSLILAVGAGVLGAVALSQHRTPRWPATAAVAVGVYVFVGCVATWIGGLMAPAV